MKSILILLGIGLCSCLSSFANNAKNSNPTILLQLEAASVNPQINLDDPALKSGKASFKENGILTQVIYSYQIKKRVHGYALIHVKIVKSKIGATDETWERDINLYQGKMEPYAPFKGVVFILDYP